MLASSRIGATHSVVFGGFSATELASRIKDCKPQLIITASCGKDGNKIIEYLEIVNKALEIAGDPDLKTVVYQRKHLH